jgi:two-component system CheB/CheR fusion protein
MTGRNVRQAGEARPQPRGQSPKPASIDFAVVALRASVGGLDVLKKPLRCLAGGQRHGLRADPASRSEARSVMVELLTGHTPMHVLQVADGMELERDHVYLIPPGAYLVVREGILRLSKLMERACPSTSPCARGPRPAAIAPSARSSLEPAATQSRIEGGQREWRLVIVQDPQEAAFDGMPRSAIATGSADLVLPVAQILQALVRYARQRYVKDGCNGPQPPDEAFKDIVDLLAESGPHDSRRRPAELGTWTHLLSISCC